MRTDDAALLHEHEGLVEDPPLRHRPTIEFRLERRDPVAIAEARTRGKECEKYL